MQHTHTKSGQRNKKLGAKVKEAEATIEKLNTQVTTAQERIAALEKELATKVGVLCAFHISACAAFCTHMYA